MKLNSIINKIPLSLGQYTSNTDGSTVHIAPKQYLNKDPEQEIKNKEQRFRPYSQLVLVPEDKVQEYPEATVFSKSINIDGINIKKNLLDAIKKNEESLRTSFVRPYHNFTQANLQEIAIKFLEHQLKKKTEEITAIELKNKTLSPEEQKKKIEKAENQRKNVKIEKQRAELARILSPEYHAMKKEIENESYKNI